MRPRKRIKTPCTGICDIDPRSGLCTSCRRTLNEIALWSSYPEATRDRIIHELQKRMESEDPEAERTGAR